MLPQSQQKQTSAYGTQTSSSAGGSGNAGGNRQKLNKITTIVDSESPADEDEVVDYRGMKMTVHQREEYIMMENEQI